MLAPQIMPAMALTLRSLTAAAKWRAKRAQAHVHEAQQDLRAANAELDQAIPSRDVGRIEHAHQRTQQAEKAVEDASEQLEIVGELLTEGAQEGAAPEGTASGEGMRGLVKSLRKH
jgi:hypothetical protein